MTTSYPSRFFLRRSQVRIRLRDYPICFPMGFPPWQRCDAPRQSLSSAQKSYGLFCRHRLENWHFSEYPGCLKASQFSAVGCTFLQTILILEKEFPSLLPPLRFFLPHRFSAVKHLRRPSIESGGYAARRFFDPLLFFMISVRFWNYWCVFPLEFLLSYFFDPPVSVWIILKHRFEFFRCTSTLVTASQFNVPKTKCRRKATNSILSPTNQHPIQ